MTPTELTQLRLLENMPADTKGRLQKALRLLAGTAYYTAFFRSARDLFPVAHRVLDLHREGITLLDCRLLITGGYMSRLLPKRRSRRRRTSGSASRLNDQTLVVLTEAGEALLGFLESAQRTTSQNMETYWVPSRNGSKPEIHYDDKSRELFVGETRILCLATKASNMSAILESFEQHSWRAQRIQSPFGNLDNGSRSQAVRDAIHRLKACQNPLVIEFHSCQKGAMMWYELCLENPSPADARRKTR